MNKRFLTSLIFCGFAISAQGMNPSLGGKLEVGHQFSLRTEDGTITRNRPYTLLSGKADYSLGGGEATLSANAGARAFVDENSDSELSVRALNLGYTTNKMAFTAGFQEVAWGETFGIYISDLVNPRDLRDPFFNDLSWIRIPTLTANAQFYLDKFSLQLIMTPVPRTNRYPSSLGGFRIQQPNDFEYSRFGTDSEYGAKLGYLFDFGMDLNVFYFHHWSRTPVFSYGVPLAAGSAGFFSPISKRIETLGLMFSKAFDKWVIRGDHVTHLNTPFQSELSKPYKTVNYFRTVLGTDVTLENDVVLGAQYHWDATPDTSEHWAALRGSMKLFRGRLEPEIFIFKGINNSDAWIQPKLSWNASANITVSAEYTWLPDFGGADGGYFTLFKKQSRIFTWVKAVF